MEQVRELGAAEAHPEEGTIRAARAALTREIARGGGRMKDPVRARRRRWTGIGIGGLVAGAAATAIVIGSVLTPPAPPSASAAEVLNETADVTIHAVDTTLKPGQYLKIEAVSKTVGYWNTAAAEDGDPNTVPSHAYRGNGDAALQIQEMETVYVPADRAADWLYVYGPKSIVARFGPRGAEVEQEVRNSPEAYGLGQDMVGRVWVMPGGVTGTQSTDPSRGGATTDGSGPAPGTVFYLDSYRPHYAEMPRDPAALLDWLRRPSGMTGNAADAWVLSSLEDPDTVNLMPADLRAAFFRAIALIPGLRVENRDGDLVTLSHYEEGNDRPRSIVIDTAQGYIAELAETQGTKSGVAGDIPDRVKKVTTTVVDALPDSVKLPEK
ncbi:hypothetical protein [Microbacterium sp. 22242]|uniref:hypothetical protein n=1 Tax=Microbacterium sp. 22242 TaxID=3453896 RepID=UPI003F825EBB